MKTFLQRVAEFSILALFLFGLLLVPYNFLVNKEIDEVHLLRPEAQVLVLGDSHPECAVNDLKYPIFENRARSAEIYFLTYFKLKNILERKPKLQAICIAYNYFSLAKGRQELFYDKKQEGYRHFFQSKDISIWRNLHNNPRHYGYTTKDNAISIFFSSYFASIECIKNLIKYQRPNYSHLVEYKGAFLHKHTKSINIEKITLKMQKPEKSIAKRTDGEYQAADLEEMMLRLMLDLAKEHNIPVVLINTPEHPIKVNNTAQNAIDYHLKVAEDLKREYGVHFLNYHDMDLPDNCFYDLGHLNVEGANRFTPILLEDLKKLHLISEE